MSGLIACSNEPCESNHFLADHVSLLCRSYFHWKDKVLVSPQLDDIEAARFLFSAPFAVVSHNTDPDPRFNYANRKAMELFEMEWNTITSLPSRMSAEAMNREARAILLQTVAEDGYIDNYSGIRISGRGRRFRIDGATVWNLIDAEGCYAGQAAMFDNWTFV